MKLHIIIASFLSGALCSMGFGSGTVMIIYLTAIMSLPQTKAQGINLMFFIPIALFSLLVYIRKGLIDFKRVTLLSSGGVLGVVLGSFFLDFLEGGFLTRLFGIFLIFIGAVGLIKSKKEKGKNQPAI